MRMRMLVGRLITVAMMGMSVMMAMPMLMAMIVVVTARKLVPQLRHAPMLMTWLTATRIQHKPKPFSAQGAAGSFFQQACPDRRGQYRANVGQHLLADRWQGIEHGGDKHIPGNSADRIQVNMRQVHAAQYLGTT
jgi:hypothetical protein